MESLQPNPCVLRGHSAPGSSPSSGVTLNRHKLTVSGERGWLGECLMSKGCTNPALAVGRIPQPLLGMEPRFC